MILVKLGGSFQRDRIDVTDLRAFTIRLFVRPDEDERHDAEKKQQSDAVGLVHVIGRCGLPGMAVPNPNLNLNLNPGRPDRIR